MDNNTNAGGDTHEPARISKEVTRAAPRDSRQFRRFFDAEGCAWEVWEVSAEALVSFGAQGSRVPADLEGGWLAFQCGGSRRRLGAYPADWIHLSDDALHALFEAAKRIDDTPLEIPRLRDR